MANIQINRVNTVIAAADLITLNTDFGNIATVINNYVETLTDEERKSLFSLQEENLVFAHQAFIQAQSLGGLIPPQLNTLVANLNNDLELNKQLTELEETHVAQLVQKIADTKRLAGHEAYVGALAVYKIIEALASMGVDGAQAAYDILKQRFENQGGAPVQPEP